MLKRYKNRLVEVVRECGFDPLVFEWKTERLGDLENNVIRPADSPIAFTIVTDKRDWNRFSYNFKKYEANYPWEWTTLSVNHNFANIERAFTNWLSKHVQEYLKELTLPDLWQQMETQKSFISGTAMHKDEITPFSENERKLLRTSVKEFRLLVEKTFQPSQDELEIINNRLDYLTKAVDRLNRFDWKSVAIQTIISISIALSLNTEKGRTLFNLFKQAFSEILHLLQSSTG